MQVLDAPMAVGPTPVDDHPAVEPVGQKQSPLGPFEKLLAAALVLFVGAKLWERGKRGTSREPEAAPASPKVRRFFPLIFLLFMTSGCAALIYEIVWFQMLQLVLGSSAVSIAVLLGTFMGGMCIGSLSQQLVGPSNRGTSRVSRSLPHTITSRAFRAAHRKRRRAQRD